VSARAGAAPASTAAPASAAAKVATLLLDRRDCMGARPCDNRARAASRRRAHATIVRVAVSCERPARVGARLPAGPRKARLELRGKHKETSMKDGVLGSGMVAQTLGAGFAKHGHEVMLGTREASKLADWAAKTPGVKVGSFAETASFADVVVLAVKGTVAADALRAAGSDLAGKVVIDATNPIADLPPQNGVIRFFTNLDESLMERLQREFGSARLVKAFNSVGNACMVNPEFKEGKPTMFICGNDDDAKKTVTGLLDQFGWETADMGKVEAARAIEPLCMLWCIPGFVRNDWVHAFKLLH
jgi:8-hydroxy-5-deazaflavin:NADPH oxidoreductase